MLNVLIADSHPVARAAFQALVEQVAERLRDECLIAVSDDALTAFRKAKRLQPDLIVLSSNLRLAGGVQDVLALRAYAPGAKLLIVGDGERPVSPDVASGADAVLTKRDSSSSIVATLVELLDKRSNTRGTRR